MEYIEEPGKLIGPFANMREAAYYYGFKHNTNEPEGMKHVASYTAEEIAEAPVREDACDRRTVHRPAPSIMGKVRRLLEAETLWTR